ncbi:eukaryotic translation initiation factor 4 gamma 3-like, partial [Pollicipes pollicipes]|uniref:eukaryotic translation initiation factor 4 gamma 3-like n=1 Tax=Pollicipes pollicipes TaxID=41117 RepID=UPI0018851518
MSRRIAIINPDTGKEVSTSREEPAPAGGADKEASATQGGTTGVAAEFAKMVAQAATSGAPRSRTTSETVVTPAEGAPPPTSADQLNGAVTSPPGAGRQSSQKKTKTKQKMRELNRRAEGKEGGGDMDAFVDSKPVVERPPAQSAEGPAPVGASPTSVPASTPIPTPPPAAEPTAAEVAPKRTGADADEPTPPVETKPQSVPTEVKTQVTLAEPKPQSTPTEPKPQPTPTEPKSQSMPAEIKPQSTSTEPKPQSTPTEVKSQSTPTEPKPESTPTEPEAAPEQEQKQKQEGGQEQELEEGEIVDGETPVVNGTAGEEEAPATPQKTKWQLEVERMKEESLLIGHKMQYDRDELLKLQVHPLSRQRPDQLPDLPSIVRKERPAGDARAFAAIKSRSMGPTTGMQDYAPGFKPLPNKGYRGGRGSQQGRREMQQQAGPGPGPRRIEISLNRDVKLRETENAWKATYKASPGDLDDESRVIRAFKGILNKITPNNIERLTGEIKKLELNTESRLHKMISTLFEKAVDEPMYADQYALLCVSMSKTEVESAEKDGKVNFRKLLLTQCQREFEKDKSSELNRDERLKEIAEEKDEEVKKEKMRSLEKESTKMRLRSNGNIRFIGELYKLGMLTDRIMHQCIVKLVRDEHEDSYECLCKLMTTIGQKLEKAEAARGKDLSSMFNGFNKVIQEKKFSSRIRFMLQDLIDMRKNGWVNTRTAGVAKPMTIEEVHKQARQQAVEQQVALAQAEDRRRNDRGS